MLPDDINDWYVRGSDGQMVLFSGILLFPLGIWFAASERYNGLRLDGNSSGGAARVLVKRWR